MAQTNTNNHLGINMYENNVWNHGTKIILQFKTLHTRKVITCPPIGIQLINAVTNHVIQQAPGS